MKQKKPMCMAVLLSLFLLFSLISLSFIFSILKSMDIMLQLPLLKGNSEISISLKRKIKD